MSNCIIFPGYKDKDGYGKVSVKGKVVRAHRHAYCEANGLSLDAIADMVVMHSCDNPSCINAEHLSIGTHIDNIADKISKGRQRSGGAKVAGERNGRAKLTKEIVEKIRNIYKPKCKHFGIRALAREYQVDPKAIRCVINGTTWRKPSEKMEDFKQIESIR